MVVGLPVRPLPLLSPVQSKTLSTDPFALTPTPSLRPRSNPTPLDCLVVAHLHVIWKTLPSTSPLRRAIETDQGLQEYARRLLGRLALKGEKSL